MYSSKNISMGRSFSARLLVILSMALLFTHPVGTVFDPTHSGMDDESPGAPHSSIGPSSGARASPIQDVVINEFMADPGFDFNGDQITDTNDEYIELYNPGAIPVSLQGCFLDDVENGGSSPHVLTGVTIGAGSHIILYRNTTRIALNNNGEERVRLLAPSGEDMDNFTYQRTEKNRSWARRGDGNEHWTMPRENTPGTANPTVPLIVINEFMVRPVGATTDEWVELYCSDVRVIDMTGWTLGDQDGNEFVFPEHSIGPGEYVVVNMGVPGAGGNGERKAGVQLYMDSDNQVLTDGGDDILLCDDVGLGVDYVSYGNGSSVDDPPGELEFSDPPSTTPSGTTIALGPNGDITDSGLGYRPMNGTNITKGWNNSLPLALDCPGNIGFNIHENGDRIIVSVANPTSTSSSWDISVEYNSSGFEFHAPERLYLDAGEEASPSIIVSVDPAVVPGTSAGFVMNLSSGAVPGIRYTVRIRVMLWAGVLVNEIMIDPPGADSRADEWIEILNPGPGIVNLTGWSLFSNTDDIRDVHHDEPLFRFPELFLVPGQVLCLHTQNPDADLFSPEGVHLWMNRTNAWTNTRGSAALVSSAGTGVDFLRWGDCDHAPVCPDAFNGSCPAPRSGESLARGWYFADRNVNGDFFIPFVENNTPGLPNGRIHSFAVSGPESLLVVEPSSVSEFEVILINTGNTSSNIELQLNLSSMGADGRGEGGLTCSVNTYDGRSRWTGDDHSRDGGWNIFVDDSLIVLDPAGETPINIEVHSPGNVSSLRDSGITLDLSIHPLEDPRRAVRLSYSFQLPVIDLAVDELYIEGDWTEGETIVQGDILRMRTRLVNLGPVNSSGSNATLYLDECTEENVIGSKRYVSIPGTLSGSTRNPSFMIDTLLYPGNHTYILRLEPDSPWKDLDASNNEKNITLNVTPVELPPGAGEVLVTEVYYYSYVEDELDEYVRLYNGGSASVDISSWQLVDDPSGDLEEGISFPPGTHIGSEEHLFVAKDAEELRKSTGERADVDSVIGGSCPEMEGELASWMSLDDHRGQVVLRAPNRRIIDTVNYGGDALNDYGWSGEGVPRCGKGFVCRRTWINGTYVDTNTSDDFNRLRQYPVGITETASISISGSDILSVFHMPSDVEDTLASLLDGATGEILVSCSRLESFLLYSGLMNALERGVDVSILFDGKPYGGIGVDELFMLGELNGSGAGILFTDDDTRREKYSRYENMDSNFIVIDGTVAILMTSTFDAPGAPMKGSMGYKGIGLVLGEGPAQYLWDVFHGDSNVSGRDISRYNGSETYLGELAAHYQYTYVPIPSTLGYTVPSVSVPSGSTGVMGMYPDSAWARRGDGTQGDIIINAIEGAERTITLVCGNIHPVIDDDFPAGGETLPQVDSLLRAAGRGLEVKVLFDVSSSDMRCRELEDERNITGPRAAARWLHGRAEESGLQGLDMGYDYLDGAKGLKGTMILIDGRTLVLYSGVLGYESLYLSRGIAVELTLESSSGLDTTFDEWWTRSIPFEWSVADREIAGQETVKITELYYYSLVSYKPDQYIRIRNIGESPVDVSWWRLSDKQGTSNSNEGTAILPADTILSPGGSLVFARNARSYCLLTTAYPDFEFGEDSTPDVPNLLNVKGPPSFTTHNDELFLYDRAGHLVDAAAYGISEYDGPGWSGPPAPRASKGALMVRRTDAGTGKYIDTNTSHDFTHPRPYRPGQSHYVPEAFRIEGNITGFTSPDSSFETLMGALGEARRTLFINVYQFHNPYIMDRVANLSKDGVDVKLLLEGGPVGGVTDYQRYVSTVLNESGAHVRYMISDRDEGIGSRYDFDHAKYAVIDNRTLVLLSENFVTTGLPVDPSYGNRGWGVVVEDAALAKYFAEVFFHDFNPAMRDSFRYSSNHTKYGKPPEDLDMNYFVRTGAYMPRFPPRTTRGEAVITPVLSPDTSSGPTGPVISMIEGARRSIKIEQLDCDITWSGNRWTYNWSDPEGYYLDFAGGVAAYNMYLASAIDAARRGVRVRVLLDSAYVWDWNDRIDNSDTVIYINKIAALEGLDMEANLVALSGRTGRASLDKVHNKGVIVDGRKVLVSSINWGRTSVTRNREAALIIESDELAAFFESVFDFDWNLSVFNFVSPYVYFSGNRSISPGGSTRIRIALTYLNETVPVTLRFHATSQAGLEINLSQNEMRIFPRETRELSIMLGVEKDVLPGTDFEVRIRLEIMNMTSDFLFFDVNVTKVEEIKETEGRTTLWESIKNFVTILLVAFIVVSVAVGRDVIINWRKKATGKGKGKGKGNRKDDIETASERPRPEGDASDVCIVMNKVGAGPLALSGDEINLSTASGDDDKTPAFSDDELGSPMASGNDDKTPTFSKDEIDLPTASGDEETTPTYSEDEIDLLIASGDEESNLCISEDEVG